MALEGKVCLVTGASFGIGRETALGLAQQGAHVVICGRDRGRTEDVRNSIISQTGNQKVDVLVADLSVQKEVRNLANQFKTKFKRLDVLINNAGAIFTERMLTVDGYERTWALNHLSYFLLSSELLDLLKANTPSRIVNVASAAHKSGTINFRNLQGETNYSPMSIYGTTKLANILFTIALARRLAGTRVTANCLHPGVVATGFGKNNPGLINMFLTVGKPFLLNAKDGAATSIYLASSPDVANVNGKYFYKCKAIEPSSECLDVDLQERLWDLSIKQIKAPQ